jgi:hypothetical protein
LTGCGGCGGRAGGCNSGCGGCGNGGNGGCGAMDLMVAVVLKILLVLVLVLGLGLTPQFCILLFPPAAVRILNFVNARLKMERCCFPMNCTRC